MKSTDTWRNSYLCCQIKFHSIIRNRLYKQSHLVKSPSCECVDLLKCLYVIVCTWESYRPRLQHFMLLSCIRNSQTHQTIESRTVFVQSDCPKHQAVSQFLTEKVCWSRAGPTMNKAGVKELVTVSLRGV